MTQVKSSRTTGVKRFLYTLRTTPLRVLRLWSGGQAREVPSSRRQTASHETQPARLTVLSGLPAFCPDAVPQSLETKRNPGNAMRCRARHPNSGALHETYSPPQRADLRVRTLEGADWRARKSSARRAPTANEQNAIPKRQPSSACGALELRICENVLILQHDTESPHGWTAHSNLPTLCPQGTGLGQPLACSTNFCPANLV